MKVKSSVILTEALALIESGKQQYVCAAILDAETQMRYDNNGENIISKASPVWMTFKPKHISESRKNLQEWWPKGDPLRIETLKQAIAKALKSND